MIRLALSLVTIAAIAINIRAAAPPTTQPATQPASTQPALVVPSEHERKRVMTILREEYGIAPRVTLREVGNKVIELDKKKRERFLKAMDKDIAGMVLRRHNAPITSMAGPPPIRPDYVVESRNERNEITRQVWVFDFPQQQAQIGLFITNESTGVSDFWYIDAHAVLDWARAYRGKAGKR